MGVRSMAIVSSGEHPTTSPLPNRGASESQGENCHSSFGVDLMRQLFILQKWVF